MNSPAEHAPDGSSTPADARPAEAHDGALAQQAQNGDRRALDLLVERHHPAVTRLLWRFVRRRADLEDLVQDTFLRMVRGLGDWREDQPFSHWLLRIATNVGRDYFRRQSVRQRHAADGANSDTPPEAPDSAPDPAARAAANEAKELLAHLSPDERALLTLYHLEGWSLRQIADQYGWTLTATKLRAWRARRRLHSLLKTKDLQ